MGLLFPALLIGCLPAFAQPAPRSEIFGTIGAGWAYDDEGSIGNGVNGGGGIGYRLTRRFGVEAEVNAFRARREIGGGVVPPLGADGVHLMGNALAHFGGSRTQFYLLGGAGLLHARNPNTPATSNGLVIGVGVGLKIYATRHLFIRPDVRLFGGESGRAIESPLTDLRLSIGVGYGW